MSSQASALSYAIRFRTVGKYFGQLCLALGLLTMVPLGVSLGFGDTGISLRYAVVLVILVAVGLPLSRLQATGRIQTNEAMVIAALVFLAAPLLMTYPMMGSGLSFVDGLFEAVSASTTTGLSTVIGIESKPLSFLFSRAWMQWYGGLGMVILFLAILVRPGLTAKTLAVTEDIEDDLAGGTKAHARRVLVVYGILTLVGILLLWLLGGDFFEAILYTFSAVSTGGFAPHELSLSGFGAWPLQWAVTLFCLAASISLVLYFISFSRKPGLLYGDLQLRMLLLLGLLFSAVLMLCMTTSGMPWPQAFHHAPLLALSAQTTAGFSTLDVATLDDASKGVLIISMAIGGGIGSTAGGFKLLRLLILLRILQITIVRTCLPSHAVLNARLGQQRLEDDQIREALCIILLFIMVITLSWLPFLVMGYDSLDALFEVVSATATVGLSAGITDVSLPWPLKGILCFDMLMGRLEIVAWLVLFYPRTWIGKRTEV